MTEIYMKISRKEYLAMKQQNELLEKENKELRKQKKFEKQIVKKGDN